MKFASVVVALIASLVVGCGDGGECDDCPDAGGVAESACRVDECPPPGGDDDIPGGGGGGGTVTRTLFLELWNADDESRICQYSYRHTDSTGSEVAGSIVAAELVSADGWRFGSIAVPYGHAVTLTASCWHPGWPEVAIRASTTLTTLQLTTNRTCRAVYDEAYGPTVALPCW